METDKNFSERRFEFTIAAIINLHYDFVSVFRNTYYYKNIQNLRIFFQLV